MIEPANTSLRAQKIPLFASFRLIFLSGLFDFYFWNLCSNPWITRSRFPFVFSSDLQEEESREAIYTSSLFFAKTKKKNGEGENSDEAHRK